MSIARMKTTCLIRLHLAAIKYRQDYVYCALLLHYDQHTHCLVRHTTREYDVPTTIAVRCTNLGYHASKQSTYSRTAWVQIEYHHSQLPQSQLLLAVPHVHTIDLSNVARWAHHRGRHRGPYSRGPRPYQVTRALQNRQQYAGAQ